MKKEKFKKLLSILISILSLGKLPREIKLIIYVLLLIVGSFYVEGFNLDMIESLFELPIN